jgi:3-hydroxyacyl-[acyl-carrier-protein] dehydratase
MRFLFYDRILEIDKGKRILGVKDVALSENFFIGHFPKVAIMPPPLVIEAVAQVAGWLINYTHEFRVSAIMSLVEGVTNYRYVNPGIQLFLEAEILAAREDGSEACGRAMINGEMVMNVERILFIHYLPPDEAFVQGERERFRYMSGGYQDF